MEPEPVPYWDLNYPLPPQDPEEVSIPDVSNEFPTAMKHLSPQDAIDKFWDNFNSKTPGKASTILPQNIFAKKASDSAPTGVIVSQNALAEYEETAKLCKAKVEKIVKECRRVNQKYRDPHFDIEFDLKWGRRDCLETLPIPNKKKSEFKPQSVKRVADIFDSPSFYIGGATVADIRQGRNGDCWLMAALCVLGNKESLIERICVARDEQIGVYGFVFHRDGEWRSEIIDDKLYLSKPDYDESFLERLIWDDRERISSEEDYRKAYQSNSGALYFAQCEDPNETWLPLLEKAYAKAHSDFASIEGGFTGEGIEDLTGGVTTEIYTSDILDREYFWKNELMKVNDEFLFGCSTGLFKGWGQRKGIQEGHAYSIMKAVEIDGVRLLLLKNPWGRGEWTGAWSDGSKEWNAEWLQKLNHRFGNDGAFWISFEDLLKKYQTFDRTRLFTSDWKVSQLWTTLQIPYTTSYHGTRFEIVLEKDAPVVIVLGQLDGRYFRGLEGQYKFELSFRLHKAGEEDYIVRSHGNYCMRRSVSAELQLEKGTYHVLLKIKGERDTCCADPVEKVVKDNCKSRRDKLLRVGLSYDLAHSKGQIVETEAEKKAREAAETRKKAKEQAETKEKLMKLRNREKHISNKAKRKAKAKTAKKAATKAIKTEPAVDKQKEQALEKGEVKPAGVLDKTPVGSSNEGEKSAEEAVEDSEINSEEKFGPPMTDKLPPPIGAVGASRESSGEDQLSPTTAKTTLLQPSTDNAGDDCDECRVASKSLAATTGDTAPNDDSDDESVASDATLGTIESEMERTKKAESDQKKCSASPPCTPKAEEEDEFQRDPWNAWCVVGLRVYSKEADVTIQVVRPNTWEDAETSLDVDDSAADATKHTDLTGVVDEVEEKPAAELDAGGEAGDVVKDIDSKSRKGSVMGFRGRIGSSFQC